MSELERAVTREIGYSYIPLTTALSESGGSLAGAALNIGTYTVGPVGGGTNYTFAYPSTAKAVNVRLTAAWAAASNSSIAYGRCIGGGTPEILPIARALVANIASDTTGIISLDSSGTFNVIVANANTTSFSLYILGYFL